MAIRFPDGFDYGEIVIEGLKVVYKYHPQEYYRALMAIARESGHANEVYRRIFKCAEWALTGKEKDIANCGVCPACGGDVNYHPATEHHPAPFGEGTAAEEVGEYSCDECRTCY